MALYIGYGCTLLLALIINIASRLSMVSINEKIKETHHRTDSYKELKLTRNISRLLVALTNITVICFTYEVFK